MDDEFYFTVGGNEWQQQSYFDFKDHPATDDVNFIPKTKQVLNKGFVVSMV
jgi:hypothetical protein